MEFGEKKPKIHPTAFIAPNAVIAGDVVVGAHSSVWFGAVIRGDMGSIRIGEYCSVQDNCVLHAEIEVKGSERKEHNLSIGDYVTIGHCAVVHGCTVGERCIIGANSCVFNDAEIGAGSIVGTGAVVPIGMKVEAKTIVAGVPAKLLRKTREEEWEFNKSHAEGYAKLAEEYKRTLFPEPAIGNSVANISPEGEFGSAGLR